MSKLDFKDMLIAIEDHKPFKLEFRLRLPPSMRNSMIQSFGGSGHMIQMGEIIPDSIVDGLLSMGACLMEDFTYNRGSSGNFGRRLIRTTASEF